MDRTIQLLPEDIRRALKKVSVEEVLEKRKTGKKGIVVKVNDTCYLYVFSGKKAADREMETQRIKYIFGQHLCWNCAFCQEGKVCPKISDSWVETYQKDTGEYAKNYEKSKRLEKYPFIVKGVEFFASREGYLIVSGCKKYKKYRGQISEEKRKK